MNNAARWNIHARAACGDAGMDRHMPPPDVDHGAGSLRIVRRSECETPRLVPPKLSRMAMQRPEFALRPRGAGLRPDCKAPPGIARPQAGGESGRNCAPFRRIARRRMPSAPHCRLSRPQHLASRATARDRTGHRSGQASDARARLASAAQAPLRRHHGQRSRRARLPGPLQGLRGRWPEPALGRRSDLHRQPRRLRLSGCDHGCVVASHRRLRTGAADRCAIDARGAHGGDRASHPTCRLHPPL